MPEKTRETKPTSIRVSWTVDPRQTLSFGFIWMASLKKRQQLKLEYQASKKRTVDLDLDSIVPKQERRRPRSLSELRKYTTIFRSQPLEFM